MEGDMMIRTKDRTARFAGVMILAVFFAAMMIAAPHSHAVTAMAENDTAARVLYLNGYNGSVTDLTESEAQQHPGCTAKVVVADEGNTVEEEYFLTADYTIVTGYDEAESVVSSVNVSGGHIKGITAGVETKTGAFIILMITGGTVDTIRTCEGGRLDDISVYMSGDADVGTIVLGADQGKTGDIKACTLENTSVNVPAIETGTLGGAAFAEAMNDRAAAEAKGYATSVTVTGEFTGADALKDLANFSLNGNVNIYLDAGKGKFTDGTSEKIYSFQPGEQGIDVKNAGFDTPARDGYNFAGWLDEFGNKLTAIEIYTGSFVDAEWASTNDPTPRDILVNYTMKDGTPAQRDCYASEVFDPKTNSIWAQITEAVDLDKPLTVTGTYPDGTKFELPVEMYGPDEGHCIINSTSADGSVERSYLIDVTINPSAGVEEDICPGYSFSMVMTDSQGREFNIWPEEIPDLWRTEGGVITVPYGMTEAVIEGYTDSEGDIQCNGQDYINERIQVDSTTVHQYKVVNSTTGSEYTMKFRFAEDSGDVSELKGLEFYAWDGESYLKEPGTEPSPNRMRLPVDLEKAKTEAGDVVHVPASYDNSDPYGLEVFRLGGSGHDEVVEQFGITLDNDMDNTPVRLEANGEKTLVFRAVSANGKNSTKYKIRLVQDTAGNSADLSYLRLESTGESGSGFTYYPDVEVDLAKAATPEGDTITVPENIRVGEGFYLLTGMTEKGGIFSEGEELNELYKEIDIYLRADKYNKKKETYDIEVVSQNKKVKKTYRVTVCQKEKPVDISGMNAVLSQSSYVFDGRAKKPAVTVDGLKEGTDFTVEYRDNIHAGPAKAVISGRGKYEGTITKSFTIEKADIKDVKVEGYTGSYDGKAHSVKVTGLTEGTTVMYAESQGGLYSEDAPSITDIGKKTVYYRVERADHNVLKGSAVLEITKADIRDLRGGLDYIKYTVTGSNNSPEARLYGTDGNALAEGQDFTYSYAVSDRSKVGRYAVNVKGTGDYTGERTFYYTVVPKRPEAPSTRIGATSASPFKVVSTNHDDVMFRWDRSAGASGYFVYYKLSTSKDYTYLGRTTGNYWRKYNLYDGRKYYFKVVPYYYDKASDVRYKSVQYSTAAAYTLKKMPAPTVKRYSSTKVRAYWDDFAGQTGYQISRSTKKTGTYIVSTYATTTGEYKTLNTRRGTTYYYKIRPYKIVEQSGYSYRVYGPWSSVRSYRLR